MTTLKHLILVATFFFATAGFVTAQSFTYQGKLTVSGNPPNGAYDFRFRIFDAEAGGGQQGADATANDVAVSNGIFSIELDFGPGAITPGLRWLEMEVRPGASTGAYNLLSPRQKITEAPYSTLAGRAMSADFAEAANDANTVGGMSPKLFVQEGDLRLADARQPLPESPSYVQISPSTVQPGGFNVNGNGRIGSSLTVFGAAFFNSSVSVGGTISGNGSGLNNLNGAGINPGTVNATALAAETFPHSYNLSLLGSLRWDLLSPKAIAMANPGGIGFDGVNIWVTNSSGNNTVSKVRTSDGFILGTFPVGQGPSKVAFDGANIWVLNSGAGTLTKLRASDGALQGTFPSGNFPNAIAFDGANIWVSSGTGALVKIRASDGVLIGAFAVGSDPRSIAFDGANIWVANRLSDSVTKLRASDGAVLGTFAVSDRPSALVFDGANVWVGRQGTGQVLPSISKLRASDGALLLSFQFAFSPAGMFFDGANIWVSGSGVVKLRSDGAQLGAFSPGTPSFEIGFDGGNIWVTNGSNDTVTKLPAFP